MTTNYTWLILMGRFFCLLLLLITGVQSSFVQPVKHPNIILILTDDLGWSCFSSQMDDHYPDSKSDYFETPHIHRFAKQSMRFTRGYAPDPICTPSRRSIQFGQTSIRQGDDEFSVNYSPSQRLYRSIPQTLKAFDKRYKAAHFGKWDLRAKITPEQLGYDDSDGDTGNKNGDISQDREEKWDKHYETGNPKQMDSITNRSIRFIQKETREKNPFYLQVSHYATHVNFESQQASYDKFNAKQPGKKHTNPSWAGMINDLDASIGRLLKEVDALGIGNNTYIFLMADNGAVEFIPPVSNRLDPPSSFANQMRNYPLRGGKWTCYEGGIRVPFIVRGPGIKAGTQTDVPVAGWDLLPTFYELASSKNKPAENIDGGSMVSVLHHVGKGKIERLSDNFFFHRYNNGYPHSAIISGDYKLIRFWKKNKLELYNIVKDMGENIDISKQETAKTKELDDKLLNYINEVNPALAKQY